MKKLFFSFVLSLSVFALANAQVVPYSINRTFSLGDHTITVTGMAYSYNDNGLLYGTSAEVDVTISNADNDIKVEVWDANTPYGDARYGISSFYCYTDRYDVWYNDFWFVITDLQTNEEVYYEVMEYAWGEWQH